MPREEYRYRSTFSLTSALDEGGWSMPHPRKRSGANYTGGSAGSRASQSGQEWKISSPSGFSPQPGWPVACHRTDYTILAHNNSILLCIIIASTDSVTNVA
jgi:hypothetical protein